jgi:hypothetical protein
VNDNGKFIPAPFLFCPGSLWEKIGNTFMDRIVYPTSGAE